MKYPLLLVLFTVGPFLAAAPGGADLLQRYQASRPRIAEAEKALAGNRQEEARRILAECLEKVPDHYGAHYLLARMDFEAKDYRGALVHIETAERALGALDEAYRKEFELMQVQDRFEEMQLQAQTSATQGGNQGATGCGTAILSYTGVQFAALSAKKNWNDDPGNPYRVPPLYHLIHGHCLAMLGRIDEAIPQYRQAVKLDPALAAGWHNLIYLLVQGGNVAQAREALLQADAAKAAIDPALRKAVEQAPGAGRS